ncbi:MAG: hypothetical protein V4773_05425 [Verrucomicrobiota bacterium]
MSKRVERAAHGPSWAEVILGAALALVLGVALGAVLLILRPVVSVKEEPKEREKGVVYHVEGSRDGSKARQALAKRKAFSEGQSVSVTEEEINALIAPVAGAGVPPEKGKDGKEIESGYFTPGTPIVRVREGVMQIGMPVTIDLLSYKLIAQAQGGIVKNGDTFVFEPTTLYLGSCPVQRIPFLAGMVRDKFMHSQSIPEDIKASWQKLANVSIEGNVVKLTMP